MQHPQKCQTCHILLSLAVDAAPTEAPDMPYAANACSRCSTHLIGIALQKRLLHEAAAKHSRVPATSRSGRSIVATVSGMIITNCHRSLLHSQSVCWILSTVFLLTDGISTKNIMKRNHGYVVTAAAAAAVVGLFALPSFGSLVWLSQTPGQHMVALAPQGLC